MGLLKNLFNPAPAGPLACSFCGRAQADVKKLIGGPGVFICEQCVALCNESKLPASDEAVCRFCGRSRTDVKKLWAGAAATICDECVGLCNDILDEEARREATRVP